MDTRLQNTIRVRQHALGVAVGGDAAAPNQAMRKIAAAAESFLAQADDIRKSLAGPSQRGMLIAERSGPLSKAINEAAAQIAQHRSSVVSRMSAPIFQDWKTSTPPYHKAAVALEVAKRFHEASPAARAKTLAGVVADPAAHLDTIESLSSVPPVITGLKPIELQALHQLAFEATKPDEFESLKIEQEQVAIASRAVHIAVNICKEAGADVSQLHALAPDAAGLLRAEPPRWIDARTALQG